MPSLASEMAGWLRQQVHAAGSRGIVVGLSGGVDSAVVARVSQLAMPSGVMTADLSKPYDALLDSVQETLGSAVRDLASLDDPATRLALANVKPRLRMATLYFVANRLNYLVAGTGNRSEIAIGYYTKYGDGGVDLLPLGSLVKSEVRALARDLGVPGPVIDKAPSAGLWLGQTDEGEMGFTYAELEEYVRKGPASVAPAVAMKIERLARASEHKRHLPPIFQPG
jgi:NAD+ synthase